MKKLDLTKLDLSAQDLSALDLSKVDISKLNLNLTKLDLAKLSFAQLDQAKLDQEQSSQLMKLLEAIGKQRVIRKQFHTLVDIQEIALATMAPGGRVSDFPEKHTLENKAREIENWKKAQPQGPRFFSQPKMGAHREPAPSDPNAANANKNRPKSS